MTEKIRIRRHSDGWHVTRPAFGFSPAGTTVYGSGVEALGSLAVPGLGPGSTLAERNVGYYAPGLQHWTGYRDTRPRWIEASA